MIHSLLNGIMSGPWFAIIVLAFIAIGGIIAVIRAITRDEDDDECECHKHSEYDDNLSLGVQNLNDLNNPRNPNGTAFN